MNAPLNTNEQRRWYQEPLVWLIISIPAVAVIVGIVLLVLSIVHYDGLVTDDYYKQGLGINKVIERSKEAERLGLRAEIVFDDELNTLSVVMAGNNQFAAPRRLVLNLRHSTRSGYDQSLTMKISPSGRYTAPLPLLVEGKWVLELEGDDWKMVGLMSTSDDIERIIIDTSL